MCSIDRRDGLEEKIAIRSWTPDDKIHELFRNLTLTAWRMKRHCGPSEASRSWITAEQSTYVIDG